MNAWTADGYIMDQDALTGYEYRTIDASRNGCGPIAVYNILRALGRDADFGAVVKELDGLHRMHRPGPTAMNAMRAYFAIHLPEMREHSGRAAALEAARTCRMGVLRYTEERIPHFVSFLRQEGGGYRFFNVNTGMEDYVCSMEMFFADHVGTGQYVSVFTLE
ncbi:MAG: hypothetical protein K6F56_05090 [Oscillospiraceae bacterium]|nr:hypothetical protein [Oscillospiraceae bacterium]